MSHYYTNEKNILIVIALLKAHNIKNIVASPGATNTSFIASIQHDPFFQIYSAVDERSAGYIACGLASTLQEPVALSCTGATASRNYMPALTEAFYRKLPILAITSTQNINRIGMHCPQVIDRRAIPNDIVKVSVNIPAIHEEEDVWSCEVKVNQALLELTRHGGMPAHINLETTYTHDFSVETLPSVRMIRRIRYNHPMPEITEGRIGIIVGAHLEWNKELIESVELFCKKNNAVVFCDHTSNYRGKYCFYLSRITSQTNYVEKNNKVNLLISIGEISGASMIVRCNEEWRINPDGEIRDIRKKTTYVFEMEEEDFFKHYVSSEKKNSKNEDDSFIKACKKEEETIMSRIPELPFSNLYIASVIANKLPENSTLYLGILNSLRCWNYFDIPQTVLAYSNTGGFGIDGGLSTLLGMSLSNPQRLFFGVLGDLSFFYDMNALGNRHIGNNLRVLLINNGCGMEFRNYNHYAMSIGLEQDADPFIAARGHNGNQSKELVKNFSENLGFEYLAASNKEELKNVLPSFIAPTISKHPILLEVFTTIEDESNALKTINSLISTTSGIIRGVVSKYMPPEAKEKIKTLINW